jgi:hypothetical protein
VGPRAESDFGDDARCVMAKHADGVCVAAGMRAFEQEIKNSGDVVQPGGIVDW